MRFFGVLGIGLLLSFISLCELRAVEVPVPSPMADAADFEFADISDKRWMMAAANDAYEMGLLDLAERGYRKVLLEGASEDAKEAEFQLMATLVRKGDFVSVEEILRGTRYAGEPRYELLRAIVALQKGQYPEARLALALVREHQLPIEDRPWYFFSHGLILAESGDEHAAEAAFDRALNAAVTEHQQGRLEAFFIRERLLAGRQVDEGILSALENQYQRRKKNKAAYEIVREYAVALDLMGQREDAIALLNKHVSSVPKEGFQEQARLRLLLGYLAGSDSEVGQSALQSVLKSKASKDVQAAALQLLAIGQGGASDADVDFDVFLTQLIDADAEHPLLDSLYMLRAQAYQAAGDLDLAEVDAKHLIERFPGSSLRSMAIRLLALVAWERDPPQYRIAADYLNRLRENEQDLTERTRLGVLAADCYFLNEDFDNAADLYGLVLKDADPLFPKGPVLFQRVLALVNKGDRVLAEKVLKEASALGGIDPMSRWRAEWNLVYAMKAAGEADAAKERVHLLLEDSSTTPFELKVRLMWLEAQLVFEMRQLEEVPGLVDALLTLLNEDKGGYLAQQEIERVGGQALLLKGQALMLLGQMEMGLEMWSMLREIYPESEAASLSYLEEARYYASLGNAVKALQRCIDLADKYPGSRYAPIALYEAAVHAELRGQTASLEKAITLLERLVKEYPENDLVYYARVKQGDLLRSLNQFGAAQLVYEHLIQQYPKHPERYTVELYRAKTLYAVAGQDASKLGGAVLAFERLLDLEHLPADLRIEAGYHAGIALSKKNNKKEAEDLYWRLISQFLKSPAHSELELRFKGRYWMARTILDLGGWLEDARNYKGARDVYMLAERHDLPGKKLAQSKIEHLTSTD